MSEKETRQAIVMAAIQLLGQKGFANVSMNDIVKVSGISKGGVYWHFKSKDDIILAIFDFFFDAQLDLLNQTLAGEGKASDKLKRIFQLATEEAEVNLPPPLEFYALAVRNEALKGRMSDYFDGYCQRVIELLQQGIDAGEFQISDPRMAAINIISLMEGVVLLGLSIPHMWDLKAQVNSAIDVVLRGINKRD
ncbi:MAG: TetR family transcriptional regulator [Anaerolineaceae bacterium]|nr:TetR family transcriptional regulator [Anaerolineaceae bacterium]